jgi:hypothetical protein
MIWGLRQFVQDEGDISNGTHICEVEIDPETRPGTDIMPTPSLTIWGDGEPDPAGWPGPWRRGAGNGRALTENTVFRKTVSF